MDSALHSSSNPLFSKQFLKRSLAIALTFTIVSLHDFIVLTQHAVTFFLISFAILECKCRLLPSASYFRVHERLQKSLTQVRAQDLIYADTPSVSSPRLEISLGLQQFFSPFRDFKLLDLADGVVIAIVIIAFNVPSVQKAVC